MAASSRGAVLGAIIGNGFLSLIKLVAFLASGSGAMLSETVHSVADTSNQILLFVGIRRSERPADLAFPYGYGAERYFFAFLSAVGIFVLGCGVSVYHGIHNLLSPPDLDLDLLVFVVLAVAFVVEAVIWWIALRAVLAQKGDQPLLAYLRSSSDPAASAVLLEDTAACLGVLIAAGGILLAHATGNPLFDAVGSILIGLLLGGVALWLGLVNRHLMLGPAIPPTVLEGALAYVRAQPSVRAVRTHRTRVLGARRFRLSVEVDFDGAWLGRRLGPWLAEHAPEGDTEEAWAACAEQFGARLLDAVGEEVDRMEAELRERHPGLEYVDIEAD